MNPKKKNNSQIISIHINNRPKNNSKQKKFQDSKKKNFNSMNKKFLKLPFLEPFNLVCLELL